MMMMNSASCRDQSMMMIKLGFSGDVLIFYLGIHSSVIHASGILVHHCRKQLHVDHVPCVSGTEGSPSQCWTKALGAMNMQGTLSLGVMIWWWWWWV